MSTILSSALRSNLNSAQLLNDQLSKTQERVSTGRKVNSAADDAYAYFSEKSLRSTSSKLESIIQTMDAGAKTIQASIAALNSISDLAERTESLVRSALETSDYSEREGLRAQVAELISSMEQMASNAGYRGVNLLGDSTNELNIKLNQDGNQTMEIDAATSADDSFTDLSGASFGFDKTTLNTANTIATTPATTTTTAGTYTGTDTLDTLGYADGATITFDLENSSSFTYTIGTAASTTVNDFLAAVNAREDFSAELSGGDITYSASNVGDFTITDAGGGLTTGATLSTVQELGVFGDDSVLNNLLSTIENFNVTLQAKEGSLSNYSVILDAHQGLTENMISLLNENADNLVVANIEEESVNLNVLQTRQQLAMISISMATQQEQNVMRLF